MDEWFGPTIGVAVVTRTDHDGGVALERAEGTLPLTVLLLVPKGEAAIFVGLCRTQTWTSTR